MIVDLHEKVHREMGILYECCLSFFLRSLLISEKRWIGVARPIYSSGNTAGSNKIVMNPDKEKRAGNLDALLKVVKFMFVKVI